MMNYYQARQRMTDKRWDYTRMNDGRVWPVGYCIGWLKHPPGHTSPIGLIPEEVLKREQARLAPFQGKFHADGHETAEAACQCYRAYLLDTRSRFSEQPDQQQRCQADGCGEWTTGLAEVEMQVFVLCQKHQTRDALEWLYPEVGSITSSY